MMDVLSDSFAGAGDMGADGSPERLHGALAHRLAVDILKNIHPPGTILPSEIESSGTLNISRSAYREAIRILAAKGMVESRPKAGTRVTQRSRWNILDPDVLGWMFETEPSEDFIKGLFELRLINEPAGAGLAALRRTDAQIKDMADGLERMAKYSLATEAGRKGDIDFHHALITATHNEALVSLSTSIGAAITWSTRFKQRRNALPRDPMPDHIKVFDAIVAQDVGLARWCMESLVRMALDDTQRSMD
jgi:DNA-binding FadR family transcriptional regulator